MARAHNITADAARAARWRQYHADPEKWFWKRVDRSGGESACWPWLGRVVKQRRGYGRLVFKGKHVGAHRMSLQLATGEDRPDEFACHRCDNPVCCNPAHLFWGTPQDNMDDCRAKGRKRGSPPKIDLSKLAERRRLGLSYSELAKEFAVNQASIGRALGKLGLKGAIRPNQNKTALRARSLVSEKGE